MLRKILFVLGFLLAFALGAWLVYFYLGKVNTKSEEHSEVLLEKIKTVCKMVTVEGYFSEVYDYKDYWAYDFSPFRKKALLRVKAKVSVGYDMSQIKIEARPDEKVIILSSLPDPGILSVDHDIDYYDISEGSFNSFSEKDYTRLNAKAKNFIVEKAKESDILLAAEAQGNQLLEMVEFIVESAGWTLQYQTRIAKPTLDSLLQ